MLASRGCSSRILHVFSKLQVSPPVESTREVSEEKQEKAKKNKAKNGEEKRESEGKKGGKYSPIPSTPTPVRTPQVGEKRFKRLTTIPRLATEICNFGEPSPLDFLVFSSGFLSLFSRFTVQFRKEVAPKCGENCPISVASLAVMVFGPKAQRKPPQNPEFYFVAWKEIWFLLRGDPVQTLPKTQPLQVRFLYIYIYI